jgi:hypothetical protein
MCFYAPGTKPVEVFECRAEGPDRTESTDRVKRASVRSERQGVRVQEPLLICLGLYRVKVFISSLQL